MKSAFRDWSDIRVFLAVLRGGSTLAASKSLGLAQPTVARRIDALEQALNLTLFTRDTRGFHPTAQALALRGAAEAMERAAETLEGAAHGARSNASCIRLTVTPQNLSAEFTAILETFQAEHPGVTFDYVSTYKPLDLCAGEADVALRLAPREMLDDRLICRRLTTSVASLYAARAYADRHGLPAGPEDLGGHRFVVVDRAPPSYLINTWLLERVAPEQIISRTSDIDAMITSVRAGIGIAPTPSTLAAAYPELIRCFPPPEGTGVPSWLLISPQAWVRPEVKAFAAFFAPRWIAHINRIKAAAGLPPG